MGIPKDVLFGGRSGEIKLEFDSYIYIYMHPYTFLFLYARGIAGESSIDPTCRHLCIIYHYYNSNLLNLQLFPETVK